MAHSHTELIAFKSVWNGASSVCLWNGIHWPWISGPEPCVLSTLTQDWLSSDIFSLFLRDCVHRPTPKSCQTEVGRGGESRVDWYGSGPYFFVQEIDLHLSFQAQQNGVLLLGAMEALQLRTRCKLTVPGSWFLFISAESHGSICKQFPVTNAEGKKTTPRLCRFPAQVWMCHLVTTSDPGQSLGTEKMESNHSLCYSFAKTPMYCINYSDLPQVITNKIYMNNSYIDI